MAEVPALAAVAQDFSSRRAMKARRRLRVNTGCLTCRQRHVKCDERKPSCANCGKKNRICRYDTSGEQQRTTAAEKDSQSQSRNKNRSPNQSQAQTSSSQPLQATPTTPTTQPHHQAQAQARTIHSSPVPNSENRTQRIPIREPTPCHVQSPQTQHSSTDITHLVVQSFSDDQDGHNTIISTVFADHQDAAAVSPFSATLGSILLDAEYFPQGGDGGAILQQLYQPSGSELDHPGNQGQLGEIHTPPHIELRVDYQIQLSTHEVPIFRNYVENISQWVDSFSSDQPFHRLVPILALRCPSLLHSCLALASKQMDLVGPTSPYVVPESESLRYYRLALSAIRTLLLHPEYAQSDEMLAACILLSTYEMIDVVGESLGSHLTGVASLLRTRQVHGNVAGIRGACYWTWYRHETWAALRTGRQMSIDETYWEPEPVASFSHLTPEDIANRVIFIFGQCINYCNDDTAVKPREARAAVLDQALDDWKAKLPTSMAWFSTEKPEAGPTNSNHFEAMWFVFPHSAVANQVYNASKIILALNRRQEAASAALRGLANSAFLSTQRRIEWHRRQIFLTANAGIPDAWSLVSSQCLYIAGLVTKGVQERQKTLDLIDQCQRSSGRKTGVLSNDLKNLWASEMEVF